MSVRERAAERGYMPSIKEFEAWLTTGDTASKLDKTPQGIKWLWEEKRLRGVRTRLGWLVDPRDVARYAGERGLEIKEEQGQ
jgi:hypothetical protein